MIAKKLRKRQTDAEKRLWKHLKAKQQLCSFSTRF